MSRSTLLLLLLATPVPASAQATNPPYLAQFPSVAKVKEAMQDKNPREMALKQMGAFWQLQEVIKTLSGRREFRGYLPDEAALFQKYYETEYYVGRAIDSAFPGPYGNAGKVSLNTPYRYSRTDVRFGIEGINTLALLPPSVVDSFYRVVGNEKLRFAARAREDSLARVQGQARMDAPAPTKLDQEQAAMRRCAESGRSQTDCMMEGIGKSFTDMVSSAVPGLGSLLKKEVIHGIRMGGVYPGTNKFSLTFYTDVVAVDCGGLVQANHEYATAIVPEGVRISIANDPKPIVLTMRGDGRLLGPGPTDITGQFQTGIEYGTRTWSDGRTEPISRGVFEERTKRCNIGSLVASGGTPAELKASSIVAVLASGPDALGKTTPAGLRLNGEYGTQTALDIEFRPEGAIVGCGPVTALKPYTVQVQGARVMVHIDNGASPLSLAVGADGRLSGSGTVRVDGRQMTGVGGDGSGTYAPRSATCPVGVLAASGSDQGAGSARASAAPPASAASAAPSGNGPAFQIVGGLPAPAFGGNALSSAALILLDTPLDNVLKEAGVAVPAGSSAPRVLEQICNGMAALASCDKVVGVMGGHTVATLKPDANGVANTPDLTAGKTYYLFGSAASQGRKVTWHLPLKAAAGWTRVVLTASNAVP